MTNAGAGDTGEVVLGNLGRGRIVMISLASGGRCRALAAERFGRLGLPLGFFDAIDGRRIGLDAIGQSGFIIRQQSTGVALSGAELGCFMSHVQALRAFAASGQDWRLILEDDAIPEPDLPEVLAGIGRLRPTWDVIKLAATQRPRHHRIAKVGARDLVRPRKMSLGAVAYLVSRSGCEKLLSRLWVIEDTIDTMIDSYWLTGLNIFNVLPGVVRHNDAAPSTIDHPLGGTRLWRGDLPRWQRYVTKTLRQEFAYARYWLRDLIAVPI